MRIQQILKFCFVLFTFQVTFLSFSCAAQDIVNVHFIDVGYGDAILLELPDGETVLIDSGDNLHADYLRKYLSSRNIDLFEAMILTHPHKNHFGGFSSLIRKWPVKKFYINGDVKHADKGYKKLIRQVNEEEIPVVILREGDELATKNADIHLSVLHPSEIKGSANENTLVLLLTFKNTSFLLTSDIYKRQQKFLPDGYPKITSANVVQVPHHGGKIAERFAAAFDKNTIFVVSTGGNQYNKPFIEELDKLKGEIFRTDLLGAILLTSDGDHIEVTHE